MRVAHRITVSRPSLQPALSLLFAVCLGLLALAVAQNPVAVVLPIGGTVAAIAMVWIIDRLQPLLSGDSAASEAEPTVVAQTDRDCATPCTADD